MKIEYLREFVLLAQTLNFSTTADKLYMTQSVLSRHISSLEGELGVQLLNRNTKSVTLTPIGTYFLRQITKILNDYDKLSVELFLRSQSYEHSMRLGLNYYSFSYFLGDVPRFIQENYPQTYLSYTTGNPDELIDYLLDGAVDAIVVANLPFAKSSMLRFFNLFEEPFFVLMPTSHPLAGRSELALSDLANETFIGPDTNVYSSTWNYIAEQFARHDIHPKLAQTYRQVEEVSIAVSHGVGLFIEGDLCRHLVGSNLVAVPLVGDGLSRTISLACSKAYQDPSIMTLIEAYQSLLRKGWNPSSIH